MPHTRPRICACSRRSRARDDNWSYRASPDVSMTLPTPDPAFHWTAEAWGHALRCKRLEAIAQHAFTTRQLQLRVGTDGRSHSSWTQATASVGAGLEQLMRVKQVHGASRACPEKGGNSGRPPLPRNRTPMRRSRIAPGLVLSVQVADCVPILMADHKTGVVAAVHAGWRGTCSGVARAAVDTMVAGVRHASGAICTRRSGRVLAPAATKWISGSSRPFDLPARRPTTSGAGLLTPKPARCGSISGPPIAISSSRRAYSADRIDTSRLCTQTHRDVFESYRVDGANAGRMAALIMVP